jgi:hypothetical protein
MLTVQVSQTNGKSTVGYSGVAALRRTSFISSASFLQSTQCLLTTPFVLTTPFLSTASFLPLTGVSEPPVRGRFVGKAPHIQAVLLRDQFDVPVRKPEIAGIT